MKQVVVHHGAHLSNEKRSGFMNLLTVTGIIHLNTLRERWNLATKPEDYKWSSTRFYESGIDEFGFLTRS